MVCSLVYSPNNSNSQGCVRSAPGGRTSNQVSKVVGDEPSFEALSAASQCTEYQEAVKKTKVRECEDSL